MARVFSKHARATRTAGLNEAEEALNGARQGAQEVEKIVQQAGQTTTRLRAHRERNGYAELFADALALTPRTWHRKGFARFFH